MIEIFEPIFAIANWNEERKEQAAVASVFGKVARGLEGTAQNLWFGGPRVLGRAGPADVEVTHRGSGEVDLVFSLALPARFSLEAPGFFGRLGGDGEPRLEGQASPAAEDAARSLLRRFQGAHLHVDPSGLRVRATPGLDADAILDLVDAASEVAEEILAA